MRKPNIKRLKYDPIGTKQIRTAMAHQKSIKITININSDTLEKLKSMAEESGIPYQRLINRTLAESLATRSPVSSRLDQLEKELEILKRRLGS